MKEKTLENIAEKSILVGVASLPLTLLVQVPFIAHSISSGLKYPASFESMSERLQNFTEYGISAGIVAGISGALISAASTFATAFYKPTPKIKESSPNLY